MVFKRYQFLAFLLVFSTLIQAMDGAVSFKPTPIYSPASASWSDPVIVAPYRPSLVTRCLPYMWQTFNYGCLGASALLLCKKQYIAFALLPAICLAAFYARRLVNARKLIKNKWSIDSVLLNPATALNKIYEIKNLAVNEICKEGIEDIKGIINVNITQFMEGYRRITRKYEARCPVHLLGECTKQVYWRRGGRAWAWPCLLSRSNQPLYRNHFENKIVATILQKSHEHHEPVEYVGFGTGDSFQDFVIVVKALAQKPDLAISVHLIDPTLAKYVFCLDTQANTRLIQKDQATDFASLLAPITAKGYADWGWKSKTSTQEEAELIKGAIRDCVLYEERMRQLINYLTRTFPRAQLALQVHESAQNYLNYISQKHINNADVIAAADIQDLDDLWGLAADSIHGRKLSGSIRDYKLLCKETLQRNPTAANFLLSRMLDTGAIAEFALEQKLDFEKPVEQNNNQALAYFYREQPIETATYFTQIQAYIKTKAHALTHVKFS